MELDGWSGKVTFVTFAAIQSQRSNLPKQLLSFMVFFSGISSLSYISVPILTTICSLIMFKHMCQKAVPPKTVTHCVLPFRVPTPPGKSWISFFKIPGPAKSWKNILESYASLKSPTSLALNFVS